MAPVDMLTVARALLITLLAAARRSTTMYEEMRPCADIAKSQRGICSAIRIRIAPHSVLRLNAATDFFTGAIGLSLRSFQLDMIKLSNLRRMYFNLT